MLSSKCLNDLQLPSRILRFRQTWPDLLTQSNEFQGKLLYKADTLSRAQVVQQGEETIEFQAEVEDSAIQSLPAMS